RAGGAGGRSGLRCRSCALRRCRAGACGCMCRPAGRRGALRACPSSHGSLRQRGRQVAWVLPAADGAGVRHGFAARVRGLALPGVDQDRGAVRDVVLDRRWRVRTRGTALARPPMTTGTTPVANEIRRLRFERGEMTQQALADACGVTRQTIIALEAGRYAPSLELAFRIARAFGVGVEDVFHWREP